MLKRASVILLGAVLICAGQARAVEQPRIVPRSQRINRPLEQVFGTLKEYFSDPVLSGFKLVRTNNVTWTLLAKRSDIDDETWTNWAFCKAPPIAMIYSLRQGDVTVTVHLERSGNNATFATVTADFQGTYALGANEQDIDCISKGVLEQQIMTVAAGGAAKSGN
jgi:hypothetical protein